MAERNLKVVIVGDDSVGKTCLLIVYASDDHRFPTEYVPTVFDNYNANVTVDGEEVVLGLWDTAGAEDYAELRPLSYTGTDVFLLCFSVVSPASYESVRRTWVTELRQHGEGARIILVGTKKDLAEDASIVEQLGERDERPVSRGMGKEMMKKIGAVAYLECSAFTGEGVREVFDAAVRSSLSS